MQRKRLAAIIVAGILALLATSRLIDKPPNADPAQALPARLPAASDPPHHRVQPLRSIAPSAVAAATSTPPADAPPPYAPDHVLVKFVQATPQPVIDEIVQRIGGTVIKTYRTPGLFLVQLPDNVTIIEAEQYFVNDRHVERVEKDIVYHLMDTPNDPQFGDLWGLHNTGQVGGVTDVDINAPEAWNEVTGSRDFVIAIIDSGAQLDHPDLAANLWTNPGEIAANGIDDDSNGYIDDIHGIDQISFDGEPEDDLGHGTHVAGTIAAVGNNDIGVAGVMWDANVMPCKVFSEYGWTTLSRILTCMDYIIWASDTGHNVVAVNASWGGGGFSWSLYDAIAEFAARDILFIAAAGNSGSDLDQDPHYPSAYEFENIISVAAIDRFGELAEFSNYGATSVDIAAPGVDILSTLIRGKWDYASGTSMAAPHVTGAIGIIKASAPTMNGQEIKAYLMATGAANPALAGQMLSGKHLRLDLPFIDLDGDLISDRWERRYGLDPADASDAGLDLDADDLGNLAEFMAKTDPTMYDTDGDTLGDGDELNVHDTNPLAFDSDDDGLDDAEEVMTYGTDPNLADTDADGLGDMDETDIVGSDPLVSDTDGDGLLDGFEVEHELDPLVSGEQSLDADGDGLTTLEEQAEATDPANADTDGDELTDGDEVNTYLTNPLDADTDADQLSDRWEIDNALLPMDPADQRLDPDADGYTNLEEYFNNNDPNDNSSFPAELSWSGRQGNARHNGFVPIHTSAADFEIRWITVLPRFADKLPNGTRHSTYYRQSVDGTNSLAEYSIATAEPGWTASMPSSMNRRHVSIDEQSVYDVVQNLSAGEMQLLAWDRASGEALYPPVSLGTLSGIYGVTADGGEAFVQNVSDLLKLDAASGAELWRTPLVRSGAYVIPEIAVNEQFVVMSPSDRLIQIFDRASGALLHDINLPQCFLGPNQIALDDDGNAYVLCEFFLSRIRLSDGAIEWQVTGTNTISGMAVDGRHVYVSNMQSLFALDRETGDIAWQWASPGSTSGNIVVTLDHVFVGVWSNYSVSPQRTVAIDLDTHEQVWAMHLPSSLGMTGDGALLLRPETSDLLVVVDTRGDQDADGLKDWWERYHDLDFADATDVGLDPDGDGLSNAQEYLAETNPRLADTDMDGLSDGTEVNVIGSDPVLADSDSDGLTDGEEVNVYGTLPDNTDSDGDGFQDGDEVDIHGTDPASADSNPEPVEPPFGSSYGNVLVVAGNRLHEYRPDGTPARSPVDIPDAIDARDLVVLPDHRIVISDAPYLHIYDPALRRFSITKVEEWDFGSSRNNAPIATAGDDILVSMLDYGLMKRLDGNGVLRESVLTRNNYARLHVGHDGFLYGQLPSFHGQYDRMDPDSLQTLQSVRLQSWNSHGLAVTASGDVYSVTGERRIEKYNTDGVLLDNRRLLTTARPRDLELSERGVLFAGSADGELMIVNQEDLRRQKFVPVGDLSTNTQFVFVASIPSAGPDTDGDELPDWWERAHGLDISNAIDATMDPDADGLNNADEFAADGNPFEADTDGDGLTDGDEVHMWSSSATDVDTDGDGLSDFEEVTFHGTNPLDHDSDGDGLPDQAELLHYDSDPLRVDTDGDGLNDGEELRHYLSMTDATDAISDFDGDSLTNIAEIGAGTDLRSWDSDDDGLSDGEEANIIGTNPSNPDSDADHMWDGWERRFGLDPLSALDADQDPDGDGFVNRVEYYASSEPDAAVSVPVPEQWHTDQGNAGHTAYVPVQLNPADFSFEWSASMEPDAEGTLNQAAIGRDRLFVSQPRQYYTGHHLLTALNRWTGEIEWQHDFENSSSVSGTAVDDDSVYVQSNVYHSSSQILAFRQDDGGIRFQAPYASAISSMRGPVVVGNGLYASIDTGGVGKFDTETGVQVWSTDTSSTADNNSPTVVGDHVYTISSGEKRLNVIANDTGTHSHSIWIPETNTTSSAFGSPMLGSHGNLVVNAGGQFTSIDLDNREIDWVTPIVTNKAPAMANGVIYAVEPNTLVAIDERDGGVLWRWPTMRNIVSDVLVTVEHVFVATDVETFAIDIATTKSDWSYPAGGQLSMSADQVLYIAGHDGTVTAIATQPDNDGDHIPDAWEQRFGFDANDASDAETDADGDGMTQRDEYLARTNPRSADSDGDGYSDIEEIDTRSTNPLSTDSDGDGLTDDEEIGTWGSDPLASDSDGDGVPDYRETSAYRTSPLSTDSDGDGWSDALEIDRGSDPVLPTSVPAPIENFMESFEGGAMSPRFRNGSNNLNGWELSDDGYAADGRYFIRPTFVENEMATEFAWEDHFADGVLTYRVKVESLYCCDSLQVYLDGQLVESIEQQQGWREHFIRMTPGRHVVQWRLVRAPIFNSEPLRTMIDLIRYSGLDRDDDGMSTDWELTYGLDPEDSSDRNGDVDGDTLSNFEEFTIGTSPVSADTDNDSMPDAWEIDSLLDPITADALEDSDEDGLNNGDEFSTGTLAQNPDTDNDQMLDGWEVANELDPLADDAAADPDGDGSSNLEEYVAGTDPHNSASLPNEDSSDDGSSNSGDRGSNSGGGAGDLQMIFLLLLVSLFGRRWALLKQTNFIRGDGGGK